MDKENENLDDSFDGEQSNDPENLMSSNDSCELKEKKRRFDSPSPKPFTVPASPPKFVSFDQLMKAASGITNMSLAHEIAVDADFKLEKTELPENSVEKQVKDVVHRAFWDSLEAKLNEDPPDYSQGLVLLAEIKETVGSLLLPQHMRLKSHIDEVLDLQVIEQKAEHETLDFGYYADFVISIMARLCAPVRDEQVANLRNIKGVIPLFKEIFSVLDLMKMDMANFTIQQIRPYIQQQSVEYERKKFREFLVSSEESGLDGLELTKLWLNKNTEKVLSSSEQAAAAPVATPAAILNEAYLELLEWPENELYPETIVMDQSRLRELRDATREVMLISTLLLVTYNTAGEGIVGVSGFKEKLKAELKILLKDVQQSELVSKMKYIANHVIREVNECLAKHGFKILSEGQGQSIQGQFTECLSKDHPVHAIIRNRVLGFMRSGLSGGLNSPLKLPPGLSVMEKELSEIAGQFIKLVSHNRAVFGLYYADIIAAILKRGDLSPRP